MKRLAVLSCVLILSTASADERQATDGFDGTAVQAAEQLTDAFRNEFAAGAESPAFAQTVRLPTADTRHGPALLGAAINDSRLYLAQLAGQGVERIAVRFAYPMFADAAVRIDEYRYYYSRLRRFLNFHGMEFIAVLSVQPYDADYLRGLPTTSECTVETAGRIAELADAVTTNIRPDYFLIDLRPSTLGRTKGCEALATADGAAALVSATLASITEQVSDARVGIMVDISQDARFLETVLAADGDHFIAASTLNAPVDPVAMLADLEKVRQRAETANREFAIGEWWLRKSERGDGGLPADLAAALLADTASVWRVADAWLSNYGAHLETSDAVLFAVLHETDLLIGAYLDSDEYVGPDDANPFNVTAEFSLGDRTRLRNKSKALREQRQRDYQKQQRNAAN
ncbi:MAG: hypothetical protein AAFZ58_00570 [Pseudomonadota bacterium]